MIIDRNKLVIVVREWEKEEGEPPAAHIVKRADLAQVETSRFSGIARSDVEYLPFTVVEQIRRRFQIHSFPLSRPGFWHGAVFLWVIPGPVMLNIQFEIELGAKRDQSSDKMLFKGLLEKGNRSGIEWEIARILRTDDKTFGRVLEAYKKMDKEENSL